MQIFQALLGGLLQGGFYGIMALGFSLSWGVLGVINLAHGSLVLLGGYLAWSLFRGLGLDPFLGCLLTGPALFGAGCLLQRLLLRHLIDRPHLQALLATFGLNSFLASLLKLIYKADPRNIPLAYNQPIELGGLSIPRVRLMVFLIALALGLALHLLLRRTGMGRSIRAVAQNRNAARLLGIDVQKVYLWTMGLSAGLAGMAGALLAPLHPLHPFLGAAYTLKAFAITVIGGMGSIPGALLGGLALGLIENLAAALIPGVGANVGVASSFAALLLVLAWKGRGNLRAPPADPV